MGRTKKDTLSIQLHPDGGFRFVVPKNGLYFELKELYDLIGCDTIEVRPSNRHPNYILIFDEEGFQKPAPRINFFVKEFYNYSGIAGTVIVCPKGMVR